MKRLTWTLLTSGFLMYAMVVAPGCDKSVNPNVASTALDLALDLRLDTAAIGDHYAALKESVSLEKGKLKFKELRGSPLVKLPEAPAGRLPLNLTDFGRGFVPQANKMIQGTEVITL